MNPEHRRADQQIAQRASADSGRHREEDEGDERLALLGGEQRARHGEDGNAEIIEIDERGWVHGTDGLH